MASTKQLTEQLHRAIQVGEIDETKALVKRGASMDMVLGMRGTALCAAIEARDFRMAKYLLDSGCDVNARDFDGEPPLLLALRKATSSMTKLNHSASNPGESTTTTTQIDRRSCLDIVELIIDYHDCNLNKVDPATKNTALHVAVKERLVEVVKWLMKSNSSTQLNLNVQDGDGQTALHLAVELGDLDLVNLLARHRNALCWVHTGEQTFVGFPFNYAGLSCMHLCASSGNTDCMKELLFTLTQTEMEPRQSHKAEVELERLNVTANETLRTLNINAHTLFERETCLHIACRHGHKDLVRLLVDWKADVHCEDSMNNTPLLVSLTSTNHFKTRCNDIQMFLLKAGANPNTKAKIRNTRYIVTNFDVTPLIMSARNNNVELAKLLISYGADVNDADSMGRTAVYISLEENSLDVASYLLLNCPGVDVNVKLRDYSTCLHATSRIQSSDSNTVRGIVKEIVQLGGYISLDKKGETPIHEACEYGNHTVLDVLLDETECIYDIDSKTLLSNAARDGQLDIVKMLLSHGADMNDFDENNPEESCFYTALEFSNLDIATYLVNEGLYLQKHNYLKLDESDESGAKGNKSRRNGDNVNCKVNRGEDDNIDTDSDTTSDSFSDCDEDIFEDMCDYKTWLKTVCLSPRSLELLCLMGIRDHFRTLRLPFKHMDKTNLPVKLINKLRFMTPYPLNIERFIVYHS